MYRHGHSHTLNVFEPWRRREVELGREGGIADQVAFKDDEPFPAPLPYAIAEGADGEPVDLACEGSRHFVSVEPELRNREVQIK